MHFGYLGGIVRYVKRHLDARCSERPLKLLRHKRSGSQESYLYSHACLLALSLHTESTDSDSVVK